MKAIFKDLFTAIKNVPAIKWIDEDFGQIDEYKERPPVKFPCALVTLNSTFSHEAGTVYEAVNDITVRIAFNRLGDRSANAPEEAVDDTLSRLDVVDTLLAELEGYGSDNISKLYIVSLDTERRIDGLSVKVLRFRDTSDIDIKA